MKNKSSLLLDTFGDTPLLRVIEFLLMHPDFDYTKSFIAKETGISRITMERTLKKLIRNDLIDKTRTIGNAEWYRLNRESPRVKVLMQTAISLSLALLRNRSQKIAVAYKR